MDMEFVATSGESGWHDVGAAFHVEVFARRFYELFNERRLDEAERMVDPQALFTDPVAREHLIGRAGYREIARRWIEAFPDVRIAVLHVHVGDGMVVRVELEADGTHRGVLALPGFPPMAPTGRHAHLTMRETSTIANGLIADSRTDVDLDALRRALGFQ